MSSGVLEVLFGSSEFSWSEIMDNLLSGVFQIIDFLFSWINIPQIPDELVNNINEFLNLIFDNLSLLGFFIRPTTLKILIPLIVFVLTFKYIYRIVMWLLRKLPFLDIE